MVCFMLVWRALVCFDLKCVELLYGELVCFGLSCVAMSWFDLRGRDVV